MQCFFAPQVSAVRKVEEAHMTDRTTPKVTAGKIVDVVLPLFLLSLLVALCIQLLVPFVGLLVWTIILAICFKPLHERLMVKRGLSSRWSAIIIGAGLSALILVPTAIAAFSAATSIPELVATVQSGDREMPPPPARLKELPIVGERADAAWTQASTDMPAFAKAHKAQIAGFTKTLLGIAAGLFVGVLVLVLAIVFAAICLAYSVPLRAYIARIFARVTGDRQSGEHYMDIIAATVKSVANGVIGVAFVQALLVGIGFFAIGIPGAGLLSLLAMALGVVQIPVIIVVLPAILYAFATQSTTVAIIFTVWSIIGSLSDAVLKPLMIGHGLEVPMPIILLGVIGGVMAFGLVGLFIGAVVLAVGYVLFSEWVGAPAPGTESADSPSKIGTLQAAE
jgi:predicted PurR-regulated permease PerM